jgi:predicted acyl esterase
MQPFGSPDGVRLQWGVRIPLRDGTILSATLYMPSHFTVPRPALFTLTPYIGQSYHDRGMYFASRGFPFLTVDVRGRGNSEGEFVPYRNEARDGYDVVEWLAQQPYCNGQVSMYGGSYGGYVQWATATKWPPHLSTIVPAASCYLGVDVPIRNNIASPYLMQWLTLVWGRTSQDKLYWGNELFWGEKFCAWFKSGTPFKALDEFLGTASSTFQEWIAHPEQDAYWDALNPSPEEYARLSIPILTITGSYDADQPGALTHYREHVKSAGAQAAARHYLVIGPWDHSGTRIARSEFAGLKVGPASLIDLPDLHCQWYAWTMNAGPKPAFLRKNVAYYVMGAETWRYADTLNEVTAGQMPLFLHSTENPTDVFRSGSLRVESSVDGRCDYYLYDPKDVCLADLESTVDPDDVVDQRMVHAAVGKHLVYHSEPFERDVEICGFFKVSVWLAIDRPDTDVRAAVYEIGIDGSSILLSTDWLRARYREGLRLQKLIETAEPLRYEFERFTFVARQIRKSHRLRLVIGPYHSIYSQKNYNSGGVVSEESVADAHCVTVRLFHDAACPSVLYVPIGTQSCNIVDLDGPMSRRKIPS